MVRSCALLAAVLMASGCGNVHTPGEDIGPSPVKPTPGVQTRMVLLAASRQDQQLDVSAQLLDGNGVGVPNVDVAFSIAVGVVTPPVAKTDATGTAKTIATYSGVTTVTATTGVLTQTLSTTGGAPPLSVSLFVPSIVINNPSQFTANVTGQPIGGPFSYAWTFGDGTSATTTTNTTAHAYISTGSFGASVKVTDGAGRSGTGSAPAVVTDPPVVAPVPGPSSDTSGLVASLTCTANAHGTASPCNVAVTYNGKALASNTITSVAWDFGDGFTQTVPNSPLNSRNYAQAGQYVVTATVTAATSDGSKTAPIVSKALTVS